MNERNRRLNLGRSTRDAFFRFAVVNAALVNAEAGHGGAVSIGRRPEEFVGELAALLYPDDRGPGGGGGAVPVAVTVVRGAVAARVRSLLLSAVADYRRWKISTLESDEAALRGCIAGLVNLMNAFPLEDAAPETDMLRTAVNTSLSKRDKQEMFSLVSGLASVPLASGEAVATTVSHGEHVLAASAGRVQLMDLLT